MLDKIQAFVDDANASNSMNDKKAAIARHIGDADIARALEIIYSPYVQFHVTSANCKKRSDIVSSEAHVSLFGLLEDLRDSNLTGHAAIGAVNSFVAENKQYEELIYNAIDKNLQTRANASLINKVKPGTVPVFDVALAKSYADRADKVSFESGEWYVSRKLDGLRCIAIIDGNGDASFFSRKGKEFQTLSVLAKELKRLGFSNVVLDGELCILDENGDENFKGIQKQFNKKGHTIKQPVYKVFDCLTNEEFETQKGSVLLVDRIERLEEFNDIDNPSSYVHFVGQAVVQSKASLALRAAAADLAGWEGLMLRKNVGYEGKRTNNLLKVKQFKDAEYVVEGYEVGPFRVIVDGREVEEELLSRVVIRHKGSEVGVGSGFSIDQRRAYTKNPTLIVGKEITVQYFEESEDEDGNPSLRFPTVKHVYENGRKV